MALDRDIIMKLQ
jgi:hypothetical protein